MKARLFLFFIAILFVLGGNPPAFAQTSVTLLLHNASVQVVEGSPAYDVAVYFSLLDSAGNPIKDAAREEFSLIEDSQPVSITSLEAVEDEPISVALLLDTSSSMTSDKMEAARRAAAKFISNLSNGDQVAVLTFDLTTAHQIDFTSDLNAARQRVELIQATPGAGTCLYDAAYQTVQMTASLSSSRRAIILLTDGVDEANGKPCSHYPAAEVVALASGEGNRIPLYTIGIGDSVDTQVLDQLSSQTGGRPQYAPGPTQLDALFGRLTDELRSQYVLHYFTTAGAGVHTLTVKVSHLDARNQASFLVALPTRPYGITFTAPVATDISGKFTVAVSLYGGGATVQQVQFMANGTVIGSDASAPYEMEWNPVSLEAGPVLLEAVARDAAGTELARGNINLNYAPLNTPVPATLEPTPTAQPAAIPFSLLLVIGGSGILLVAVVTRLILLLAKRHKEEREEERDREWKQVVEGAGAPSVPEEEERTIDELAPAGDRTLLAKFPGEGALGFLTILNSDDAAMIQQRIEINQQGTRLGRKADNDIIFAKDSPVSRHHATIEERAGQMYLSEVLSPDENNQPKPPTYGTYVNDQRIKEATLLKSGDEIRLGKRVRLRFESVPRRAAPDDDRTVDQGDVTDNESTMDYNKP